MCHGKNRQSRLAAGATRPCMAGRTQRQPEAPRQPPSYTSIPRQEQQTHDYSVAELEQDLDATNLDTKSNYAQLGIREVSGALTPPVYDDHKFQVYSAQIPLGAAPGTLVSSIRDFATGKNWDADGTRATETECLLGGAEGARKQLMPERQARRRCCGRKSRSVDLEMGVDTGFNAGAPLLSSCPLLPSDLARFNAVVAAVRTGECGSKCKAKRAIKDLTNHLYEAEMARMVSLGMGRGCKGRLNCGQKKELWRECKAIRREMKESVREAWQAAP